jgi:hypothetical protein
MRYSPQSYVLQLNFLLRMITTTGKRYITKYIESLVLVVSVYYIQTRGLEELMYENKTKNNGDNSRKIYSPTLDLIYAHK